MENTQGKKKHAVLTNSIIRTSKLLDVLKKNTDERHRLTQAELLRLLKEKMTAVRKKL